MVIKLLEESAFLTNQWENSILTYNHRYYAACFRKYLIRMLVSDDILNQCIIPDWRWKIMSCLIVQKMVIGYNLA